LALRLMIPAVAVVAVLARPKPLLSRASEAGGRPNRERSRTLPLSREQSERLN